MIAGGRLSMTDCLSWPSAEPKRERGEVLATAATSRTAKISRRPEEIASTWRRGLNRWMALGTSFPEIWRNAIVHQLMSQLPIHPTKSAKDFRSLIDQNSVPPQHRPGVSRGAPRCHRIEVPQRLQDAQARSQSQLTSNYAVCFPSARFYP